METVRLCALGSLRLIVNQTAYSITASTPALLLGYVICHAAGGQPIARSRLAGTLWPDVTEAHARRNLTDALYRLRRTLGLENADRVLRVGDDTIALGEVVVDVHEFRRLSASPDPAHWPVALDLYTADLLADLDADWLLAPREQLHTHYLSTLERVCQAAIAAGDLDPALGAAHRWAQADPLSEHAHVTVMRLLARLGRHAAALQQYDRLVRRLDVDLGVAPLLETHALAEAIRRDLEIARQPPHRPAALPFVGRARERALILEAVEAVLTGRGDVIAIEGEAGLGKSRLLDEITAGASWRGVAVAIGRVTDYPAASPLSSLSDVLSTLLTGVRAAQIETLLPAETLAALTPINVRWQAQAVLPELPPLPARQRFHQALVDLLKTLGKIAPLVIVMDDVQYATAAWWEAMEAVLPALAASRVLMMLAYRRSIIEQTAGWAMVQRWERAGGLKAITLSALTQADIAQLLPPGAGDAGEVLALTGGNPFLVSEVIADLRAGQPLRRDPIHGRIAGLSPAETTALEAAAVLGLEVGYAAWARLTDLPPLTLAQIAGQLAARGLLQAVEDGYVFAHEIIHSTIYDALPVRRCRRLHSAAADSLAAADADNWRARAFHLDRAGRADEAAAAYHQAGTQDQARFAFGEARAAFERGLQLSANVPTPERLETLFDLVQICDNTGDRGRQLSALHASLQDAQQLEDDGNVIRALLGLGRLAAVTGDVEAAAQRLNEARVMAQHSADHALQFDADFYSGDLAARRGRLADAHTHFELARQHAQLLGDSRREGRALRGLGIAARLSGDLPQALALTEQALALQKTTGDLFGASVTMTNLLATLYELGAHDRSLALADEALALKEKLGDRHGAAIVRHQHGLAACALGEFDLARQRLNAALQDFEVVQDRRTAGLARNVLGLVAESEGRYEAAQHEFETALASAEAVGAAAEAAYAQHDLGALRLRLNDHAAASALLEAARARWRELGNDLLRLKSEAYLGLALLAGGKRFAAQELAEENWLAFQRGRLSGEQPQGWLWALYQLLMKLNQHAHATSVLRAAYAELQRQGEAITDGRLRRQFFNRVPLNRAIVDACDHLNKMQRRLTVTLVRADVPLGRQLSDRDYVTIEWTIAAPEDDALTDRIDRRRHILSRLIEEARSAGAAPTDHDLARALDVSRRTIMRDIEALLRSGIKLPTRRRK